LEYIICCLNIKESYARITNHFKGHPYIGFEEFTDDIDEVKNKSLYKKWQLAVVDRNLPWYSEAVKFFKKTATDIIYFDDDYSEVISSITNKIQKPPEDYKIDTKKETIDLNPAVKVRYIEKQVPKIVEKKIYTGLEKKLIVVSGLSRCAGSTTLTLSIAKYLSNMGILSSVIEPPLASPVIFNWMGIEDRLDKSMDNGSGDFYSYPHEIYSSRRIKSKAGYVFDGTAWIVPDDRREKISRWEYENMVKLIYSSNSCPITLIDVGANLEHESVEPLLSNVDLILTVIDPFPTGFSVSRSKFKNLLRLKDSGYPLNFIINKWNSGIEKKEFLDFIKVEPVAFLPAIDTALLYRANYECRAPISCGEVYKLLESPLKKISSLFLPEDFKSNFFRGKNLNKSSFFKSIKKKFKKSKL
jgi:hypothetical protein